MFLQTRPQKAADLYLSEMARSASCLWTVLSRSALRRAANLVVSSWAYLLSIHSWVSRVMGSKLASGVLEAITIGLKTEREEF